MHEAWMACVGGQPHALPIQLYVPNEVGVKRAGEDQEKEEGGGEGAVARKKSKANATLEVTQGGGSHPPSKSTRPARVSARWWLRLQHDLYPLTLNPKPYTLHHKSQTLGSHTPGKT